jgi:acyl-CoA thioesterase
MATFDDVTTWAPRPDGALEGEVPPEWMQGRAAFGGLVAAAAMRALTDLVGPERPVRSFSLSFVAPVGVGAVLARPVILRAGRALTHGEVRVEQGGQLCAVVLAAFGEDRPSTVTLAPPAATPPSPPDATVDLPYIEGVVPRFVSHFQLRWADGAPPFTGAPTAQFGGWCRHRTHAPGLPGLIGLLDAWPAPVLPMLRRPAPASTARWTAHLVGDTAQPAPADAWYWYTSQAITAGAGYAATLNHLYGPDGALVAWSEQLVVVFEG